MKCEGDAPWKIMVRNKFSVSAKASNITSPYGTKTQLKTQKFDRIEISAPFDVIVEKGDHHEVKITGESNVIP